MTRRDFIKTSATSGGAVAILTPATAIASAPPRIAPVRTPVGHRAPLPDLAPAQWVWYPSGRCLQNTFILFRREIELPAKPIRATGWIAADSRYRLEVNGQRVQWGPAPADPRWAEADPIDLGDLLKPGRNVIGATVLFYGQGDGTWPLGKPGFLFRLDVEMEGGQKQTLVSNKDWKALLARAWQPGHYKRWYLRALQEEFDARLYPDGWSTAAFATTSDWLPAMPLNCPPGKPSVCSNYPEYMLDIGSSAPDAELRARSVPLLKESLVNVHRLAEAFHIEWRRSPREYFEFRPPDAFDARPGDPPAELPPGHWQVRLDGTQGVALTFELAEQVVGWPFFTIEAPSGVVVELLVHEAHEAGGPPLLNTHFESWTRVTCREGVNRFETFDFESCRWIQLHIHGPAGSVTVSNVGMRRRVFPWPQRPRIHCSEPALQRLFESTVNTLDNCAQETLVDGMARERQQYSGDCGHQLHAIYMAFGETRLPARYLTTFSQGMTVDGYFLDCWPAYDRLARLIERQLQLSGWGPILDHGVGFVFDCWHHYLYSGDLHALAEPYPRLLRFAAYLEGTVGADGLLPVENLGIPSVWIDHAAYQRQRHKQCAFNLYAAAMLQHALAAICRAFGDTDQETAAREFGRRLLKATVARYWSAQRSLFVNNLPWVEEEKHARLCDRSLATALLFDQFPHGRSGEAVQALAHCPPEMGFSYPANAGWRLWALAKAGRPDVILGDLRTRWATMNSVKLNNTLQEDWLARPDSGAQWSHCAVVPLYIAYMSLAGIRPLAPGFKRIEIRPQLGDLERLELTAQTPLGPLLFDAHGGKDRRELVIESPPNTETELILRREEQVRLDRVPGTAPDGCLRYRLPAGARTTLPLKFL